MESWTEEQGIKFIGKPFETFGDVLDDNALQIIFRISGGTELLDHLCWKWMIAIGNNWSRKSDFEYVFEKQS